MCEQLRSSYGVASAALYGEQERQERVALMRALTEGRVPLLISTEMGRAARHTLCSSSRAPRNAAPLVDFPFFPPPGLCRTPTTLILLLPHSALPPSGPTTGARGLDLPLLSHVVNLELPTDHLHYVHRAGRVGRAGAHGTVLSLVAAADANVVEKFASRLSVTLVPTRIHGGALLPLGRRPCGQSGRPSGRQVLPQLRAPVQSRVL